MKSYVVNMFSIVLISILMANVLYASTGVEPIVGVVVDARNEPDVVQAVEAVPTAPDGANAACYIGRCCSLRHLVLVPILCGLAMMGVGMWVIVGHQGWQCDDGDRLSPANCPMDVSQSQNSVGCLCLKPDFSTYKPSAKPLAWALGAGIPTVLIGGVAFFGTLFYMYKKTN